MRNYNLKTGQFCKLEVYDGNAMFIGEYVMQLLLQFMFAMLLVFTNVSKGFTSTLAGICIVAVLNQMAMIVTPLAYSKIRSTNVFKDMGFKTKIGATQILTLVLISICTILAFSPLANWFIQLIELTGFKTENIASLQINKLWEFFVALIVMCILPAICEEILFRGMMARSFADKGYIFAIFMSGMFFAIMHGNPVQLIHQFFLGCVCAAVYFMSGSIWAAIIVHFTNNFVAVLGNYIGNATNANLEFSWWIGLIMLIVGLASLTGAFLLFYKLSVKRRQQKQYDNQKEFGNIAEKQLGNLFESEKEVEAFELDKSILEKQMQECTDQEMQEVLLNTRKEELAGVKKKNKLSMIYALLLGIVIWIINTVLLYLG